MAFFFFFPLILCLAQDQRSTKEREEAEDCPCLPSLALDPKVPAQAELSRASGLVPEWPGRVQPPGESGGQVGRGAGESVVTGTATSHQ